MVHYVSEELTHESVMLGCNRVTGRHTSENILLWYQEIISEFDVGEKVKHIVTDSASNMRKAFITLPGYEEDSTQGDDDDQNENCSIPFEHHACFAHSLQLVVKDGMEKAGQISTVLKRCSKLVSFVRRSTIATDLLKDEKRLQADNVTRWNSQLKMVRYVLSIPEIKLSGLEGAPKLTTHERNLLRDIVEI